MQFFPYDLQVAKDCVNEGLTMDKSCWDIYKDNIYQDVRGSLSGHSKKGDYEKHEYAFDVMSVD